MIFINFTLISFVKIFKKITFLKSQARIFVAKVKKKAKFAFHSVCVASLWPKKGTFSSVEISFRCWFITNVSVDIGVGTHKLWRCWKQSLCLTFYSKGFFFKEIFSWLMIFGWKEKLCCKHWFGGCCAMRDTKRYLCQILINCFRW